MMQRYVASATHATKWYYIRPRRMDRVMDRVDSVEYRRGMSVVWKSIQTEPVLTECQSDGVKPAKLSSRTECILISRVTVCADIVIHEYHMTSVES